jgi:hypothetical protein
VVVAVVLCGTLCVLVQVLVVEPGQGKASSFR